MVLQVKEKRTLQIAKKQKISRGTPATTPTRGTRPGKKYPTGPSKKRNKKGSIEVGKGRAGKKRKSRPPDQPSRRGMQKRGMSPHAVGVQEQGKKKSRRSKKNNVEEKSSLPLASGRPG